MAWISGIVYQLALVIPTTAVVDGDCYGRAFWNSRQAEVAHGVWNLEAVTQQHATRTASGTSCRSSSLSCSSLSSATGAFSPSFAARQATTPMIFYWAAKKPASIPISFFVSRLQNKLNCTRNFSSQFVPVFVLFALPSRIKMHTCR